MLRVGNDIVDLSHPHAKGKSRDIRFLKRVFLPEEEGCILAYARPDAMLWALWTGKEAAYKTLQKDNPDISSAPRRYRVALDGQDAIDREQRTPCLQERVFSGIVDTPRGTISLHTLMKLDYVHSVALPFPYSATADRVFLKVEQLRPLEQPSVSYESLYVRDAAIRELAGYFSGGIQDIEIRRNGGLRGLGPPQVYFQGQPASIDISLSHDGAFAAYAFTLLS